MGEQDPRPPTSPPPPGSWSVGPRPVTGADLLRHAKEEGLDIRNVCLAGDPVAIENVQEIRALGEGVWLIVKATGQKMLVRDDLISAVWEDPPPKPPPPAD